MNKLDEKIAEIEERIGSYLQRKYGVDWMDNFWALREFEAILDKLPKAIADEISADFLAEYFNA